MATTRAEYAGRQFVADALHAIAVPQPEGVTGEGAMFERYFARTEREARDLAALLAAHGPMKEALEAQAKRIRRLEALLSHAVAELDDEHDLAIEASLDGWLVDARAALAPVRKVGTP